MTACWPGCADDGEDSLDLLGAAGEEAAAVDRRGRTERLGDGAHAVEQLGLAQLAGQRRHRFSVNRTALEGREAGSDTRGVSYLPIAEHGVIGDLHTVALVGTDGTIDWYCCPRFDSPSVFGAILDEQARRPFRIAPRARGLDGQAALLPGHERPDHALPHARTASARCTTSCRSAAHGGEHRHRLVRRVLAVRGEMRFRVECEPRFDYAPRSATRSTPTSTARLRARPTSRSR